MFSALRGPFSGHGGSVHQDPTWSGLLCQRICCSTWRQKFRESCIFCTETVCPRYHTSSIFFVSHLFCFHNVIRHGT